MYRTIGLLGAGLSLASTITGFYNFKTETEAGAAGVANFLYFAFGELLWRTKEGRDSFMKNDDAHEENNKKKEQDEQKPQQSAHERYRAHTTAVYDRATTFLCGSTLSLNALAANIICLRQNGTQIEMSSLGSSSLALRVLAWSSIVGATLLRRWSMLTLGSRFTMALATVKDHKVCREGPFRWIRHPGYLSNGLMMASYSFLVTGRPVMVACSVAVWLFTWTIRVHFEEKMLKKDAAIGEDYKKYCGEVRSKFIPLIY